MRSFEMNAERKILIFVGEADLAMSKDDVMDRNTGAQKTILVTHHDTAFIGDLVDTATSMLVLCRSSNIDG